MRWMAPPLLGCTSIGGFGLRGESWTRWCYDDVESGGGAMGAVDFGGAMDAEDVSSASSLCGSGTTVLAQRKSVGKTRPGGGTSSRSSP
ncbi:hypothetical protein PLICRDRAFT_582960 [Plicaturopsis crispa FD-325 SS-3]|nr:hypothetical protein PLICRDRAFT_582960 [Plicaturopsis crispa FD-325 SS-3]